MNRKLLFIPLVLFLLLVAALMVQLTRNAGGEIRPCWNRR